MILSWKREGLTRFKYHVLKRSFYPCNTLSMRRGFTLIELLIVMAVIGVLASLFITNYPASRKRSRDTIRRSDIKQFQTAIETYANKNNGFYPINTTGVNPSSLCGTGNPLSWLTASSCPSDSKDGQNVCSNSGLCRYRYMSNAAGTEYSIWARLEVSATSTTNNFFIVCSTGVSKESATQPTLATLCP